DFALQLMRALSTGREESLKSRENVEKQFLRACLEIKAIFARTGTAEVATNGMPPNISDGIVLLIPLDQCPNPKESIDELRSRMLQFVNHIPGNN
ncbi:hypothetical protein, partial [Acinetobacter baumannii]|uniref:hypothetical protein n=1 Tax=Acinetobacter baumannii TaxID=470 RepID=UPI000AD9FAE4